LTCGPEKRMINPLISGGMQEPRSSGCQGARVFQRDATAREFQDNVTVPARDRSCAYCSAEAEKRYTSSRKRHYGLACEDRTRAGARSPVLPVWRLRWTTKHQTDTPRPSYNAVPGRCRSEGAGLAPIIRAGPELGRCPREWPDLGRNLCAHRASPGNCRSFRVLRYQNEAT